MEQRPAGSSERTQKSSEVGKGRSMRDFFAFRTMIAGSVIQVVFVLGLIGIVIGSIGAIANDQTVAGLLIFIFGALYWRILCELLIVVFRMNSSLNAIRQNTAGLAPASSIPASPVDARREEPELTPSTAHAVSGSGSDAPGSCNRRHHRFRDGVATRGLVRRLRTSRPQALVGWNSVGDEGRRASVRPLSGAHRSARTRPTRSSSVSAPPRGSSPGRR